MKKAFFYLFAMLFWGFMLVSCEPNPDIETDPDKSKDSVSTGVDDVILPEGTVRLQALSSQYNLCANMDIAGATHSFLLMFATEDCEVVQGTAFGSGKVLVLELFSETADNVLPKEGLYKIEDGIQDGSIVAGFDMGFEQPFGTYIWNMVDDEFVGFDLITTGGVEIKKTGRGDEMEFVIYTISEAGEEGYYYYKGELLIEDLSVVE